MRKAAIVSGCAAVLLAVVATALYFVGSRRLARRHEARVAAIAVPSDDASIARGRHIAANTTRWFMIAAIGGKAAWAAGGTASQSRAAGSSRK